MANSSIIVKEKVIFPAPLENRAERFSIDAYGIAKGCVHTRRITAYFRRLLILAALSQIPYDLMFHYPRPDVIFTLIVSLRFYGVWSGTVAVSGRPFSFPTP